MQGLHFTIPGFETGTVVLPTSIVSSAKPNSEGYNKDHIIFLKQGTGPDNDSLNRFFGEKPILSGNSWNL